MARCPNAHELREYLPAYNTFENMKAVATMAGYHNNADEAVMALTQMTPAALALQAARRIDIICDVCFQPDGGRHRKFWRCTENCNYDLCQDCYSRREEFLRIDVNIDSGS